MSIFKFLVLRMAFLPDTLIGITSALFIKRLLVLPQNEEVLKTRKLDTGDIIEFEGWTFEVKKIQAHRIERMRIYKQQQTEEEE